MDQAEAVALAATFDQGLADRLSFIYELDKLKTELRQTLLVDESRRENSAEHSWHLAMIAMVMAPHAKEPIDLERAIRILLIHDIVEIDAGDVDIYDYEARKSKEAEEIAAADRIFALLPEPEASELRALWDEYEARETPEARFAYSCDRLQPFLMNLAIGGKSWTRRGVNAAEVKAVNSKMADGLDGVWGIVEQLIDRAVVEGTIVDG
ncbi:MAG: HD domain-containing protein [Acidimicrobiales bacterium]|jgi:putative hydrolase of HD superfamily|nr:HD domain-containing protein [Acidimicrobiales bacterium]